MIYQVLNIKRDVRVCLDENRVDTSLLSVGDADTLSLDTLIGSKILEAVDRVHSEVPYYLLEVGNDFTTSPVTWDSEYRCGYLLLPDDFLRLIVFEMSDWERPVYADISTLDPEYAKQKSRVKGIRGTAERPVVAIGMRPVGRVLEFYSCKSHAGTQQDPYATVSMAEYVPRASEDALGGVNICERCYRAVVYTTAGLTLVSCGEVERAKNFFEMAKTLET